MPHINRIRVNNVKYNFGTQYYDDFLMRFSCKNTIYDLANGGGKSVLMLLLLQNLIPNCTLDDKQPIEKLFRTHNGSTTIHSLVEWRLAASETKENYKYMLTGFCARKAKNSENDDLEEVENLENIQAESEGTGAASGSIEYFNYVIFYRQFNENDIKNLPLSKDGERITYTGLRNHLKKISRSDMSLEVHVFDTKREYQRFIADFGLYESQWEIVRGINKTEGHVRTYFETNYKTTRKVVENLLIENIIEKSYRNRYAGENQENNMAGTLLSIKDKLLELSKKKAEINNYDRQIDIIDGFREKQSGLRTLFSGIDNGLWDLKRAYNTVNQREIENKNELRALMENRVDLTKKRSTLTQKVDTAAVLRDMEQAEIFTKNIEEYERKYEFEEGKMQDKNDDINLLQAWDYYRRYLNYKDESDKLKIMIENVLKDNQDLVNEIGTLVAYKKYADDKKKAELTEEIAKKKEQWEKDSMVMTTLEDTIKEEESKIAVLKYQTKTDKEESDALNQEIARLVRDTDLVFPKDAYEAKKKTEKELEVIQKELEELTKKTEASSKEIMELRIQQALAQRDEAEFENADANKETRDDDAARIKNKIEKLKEVYEESDLDEISIKINKIYDGILMAIVKDNQDIKELKAKKEALKSGKPFAESQDIQEVKEYIQRYHGKVITGMEYLMSLPEKDRVAIVTNQPMITKAIIAGDNYSDIIIDDGLIKMAKDGEGFLIINGKEFGGEILSDNSVNYITNKDIYTESYIEKALIKVENELKDKEELLERHKENADVVMEDLAFSLKYVNSSSQEVIKDSKESLLKIREDLKLINERLRDADRKNADIKDRIVILTKKNNDITFANEKYGEIVGKLERADKLEVKIAKGEKELDNLEKNVFNEKKRLEAGKGIDLKRQARINAMIKEVEIIEKNWNEIYSVYFDEKEYEKAVENAEENISEDLENKIQALIASLKNDNSSMEDKEKLLGNYQENMKSALRQIKMLGISTEDLEKAYKDGEALEYNEEEVTRLQKEIREIKRSLTTIGHELNEVRSKRDKMEGRINHGRTLIESKYGSFDKNMVSKDEIASFLNENSTILAQIENQLKEVNTQIQNIETNQVNISVLKKDITRTMEKSKVTPDESAGMLTGSAIEEEINKINKNLDAFINERYKKLQEFEREKGMLSDTLIQLGARELAEEIRSNVEMPSNVEEVDDLIERLKDTTQYINLEKERIIKGFEDIQTIKDKFENQCIQNCINIKTELDRLPELSKINLDGKDVSVVGLKIPYVAEELYKDRMSEYIDAIAAGVDEFNTEAEKIRYIKNNLSWKKLFSVIVRDMNAIKLSLYKRERIASQSRLLPYEEAVGSTGQSQGIYIQFLIAVINYISCINSGQTDTTKLRKVIFIDNPFGAAKDIYIWEPIFKLLKVNNVQLIVPSRGVTPSITGRFDVNYVLGQKMTPAGQQTVVVDYYSNVKTEEMDYETMDFQQIALF